MRRNTTTELIAVSRPAWLALAACLGLTVALTGFAAGRATSENAVAPPVTPEQATFFETKIRPVLADNCYSCHGKDSQLGGLRVDSRAALLKGGDSGAVSLVPGQSDKSLLIEVIRHTGKIKMPQGGKLKDHEIADLDAWVKMGAPWPGSSASVGAAAATVAKGEVTAEHRKFWSLQPVRKPKPPVVKNAAWAAKSPIDRFIQAKLQARKLTPAPPADKRTLIRRVTFDLTGLPPTPREVETFLADKSPNAFAKVVDRLLASPRYGERWARHWLDIARYADTKGYVFTEDRNYPNAYTYRDWVINAFNTDLPYDQFIIQQIAADRLPLGDDKRPLAALGFLTVGRRFLNNQADIIDDRIDTTMRGFQGMTVACARCHDHKFDPIPTKDYYSLYGVFASSVEASPPISPKPITDPYMAHEKQFRDAENEYKNTIRTQTAALRERLKKGEALPEPVKDGLQKVRENEIPGGGELTKIEAGFEQAARDRLPVLRQTMEKLKGSYPPKPEFAMAMNDAPNPVTPHVFKRGNPGNKGDEVPRRFLAVLSSPAAERAAWTKGSGRLELAQSIASKSNPLTARVMVNRLWMHHFGAGLVRTPSDFGRQGEKPTHPELLDYLAASFLEHNWSLKKMHRMILLSATYQQSSAMNLKHFNADPENRLVWRMNRRRLDLEQMRDSLLYASGKLDTAKVGGPSVELWNAPYPNRRTVYGRIERQNLPGVFRTFDFAGPDSSTPQRFFTTVPQQALFLLNNPFVAEQVRALAARPDIAAKKDEAARVRLMYYLLFNRVPDKQETAFASRFLSASQKDKTSVEVVESPWRYGYGGFDPATKRVTTFTPLPRFVENVWRGGDAFPDPKLHFLVLTPTGGHVGIDDAHAAIRRWVAPRDGVITITGTVGHTQPGGDGVEAKIVSSREGLLGTWTAFQNKADTVVAKTTVRKGDTIDFVASCRTGHGFDSFTWSPEIKMPAAKVAWSANGQFAGPPPARPKTLGPWERYAQALILTNEFMFVD